MMSRDSEIKDFLKLLHNFIASPDKENMEKLKANIVILTFSGAIIIEKALAVEKNSVIRAVGFREVMGDLCNSLRNNNLPISLMNAIKLKEIITLMAEKS